MQALELQETRQAVSTGLANYLGTYLDWRNGYPCALSKFSVCMGVLQVNDTVSWLPYVSLEYKALLLSISTLFYVRPTGSFASVETYAEDSVPSFVPLMRVDL